MTQEDLSFMLNPETLHTFSVLPKDPSKPAFGDNTKLMMDGKELVGVTGFSYTRDATNPVPEITLKLYGKLRSEP